MQPSITLSKSVRIVIAALIPLLAAIVQNWLWRTIPVSTWMLMYPAVFFSVWAGGLWGGIIGTLTATLLGVYYFIPPAGSWLVEDRHGFSVLLFAAMGGLLSFSYGKLVLKQLQIQEQDAQMLRAQHERLCLAMAAAHAGWWEWDSNTNQVYWSDDLASLYGLDPRTPPSYEHWLSSVHPDDREAVTAQLQQFVQQQQAFNLEWRVNQPGVTPQRWLMSRGQPVFTANGQLGFYRGIVFDISQRKRQEQVLKEQERRLDFALSTLNTGAWELNLIDHTAYRTLLHDQIFGYQTLLPEWTYEQFLSHVIAEDRDEVSQCFDKALATHSDWNFECRIKRVDDEIRWIFAKGQIKFDQHGQPALMAGIVQDITERKQAEAEKRYAETRYQALVDQAIPDGVYLHDHDGVILDVNQVACAKDGYNRSELLGQNVADIEKLENFDLAQAQTLWAGIEPGTVKSFIGLHRRKDGSQYPAEVRICLLLNEGMRLYIAFVRDITEQQQTEQTLQQSEQRYRLLFEANPLPLWIYDLETLAFLDVNDAAIANYGYSRDEFLAMTIKDIRPPEQIGDLLTNVAATADRQDHYNEAGAWLHRRKDGSVFWAAITGHTLNLNGKPAEIILARDITEQRLAELELKQSEARWQFALEGSNQGVWDWDISNDDVYYSPGWKALLGYAADELSPDKQEWLSRVHPDDLSRVMQAIQRYFQGETQNYQAEYRMRHRSNEYLWILAAGKVIERAPDGQPKRMIGTQQNISARKKIEHDLLESQTQLSLFIQHAPAALAMLDRNMRYLAVSNRWLDDYGLQGQNIMGRCHYEIFPEIGDAWKSVHRRALAGEVIKTEQDRFVLANGEVQWQRWEVRPWRIPDNGIGGIAIFTEDITQSINVLQALAQSERRFQDVAKISADWIWEVDIEGRYSFVSDSVNEVLGYTPEELLGRTPFELMPAEEALTKSAEFAAIAARRASFRDLDNVNMHKDGSLRIIQTSGMPIFDMQGNLAGYRGLDRDVTERKQQEQELMLYREHLEKLVAERTQEFNQARDRAEQLAKVKSEFLANMSHEIRTPMNAVLGFCYLLEQKPLDKETKQLVNKIHLAGQSLMAIINDILDFSKIEAGRLELENAPFRLSDLLGSLAALMADAAAKKQLELLIVPEPEVDAVIGDSLRLQQVLLNLLNNAIKFTETGYVELRLRLIEQQQDRIRLRFAVKDSGIGISATQKTAIFQAFSQADATISRRFGGSGLGLAISRRLVQLMGGELEVDSVAGEGSEFWFVLPLQRQQTSGVVPLQPRDLQVLVIDDNEHRREALILTARSLSWHADGASGLAQASERQHKIRSYDLLLLDGDMSETADLESVASIKQAVVAQDTQCDDPPIVLLVTKRPKAELEKTRTDNLMPDGILNKPVTPSALYNAVASAWNKRQHPASLPASKPEHGKQLRIPGLRVLVVDDSEFNREVAMRILEADGALVNLANDGQAALDWLAQHADTVDVILMDVQMPRMDGYEATRHIRLNPEWQHLPIIALTAGAFKTLKDSALAAGMNDFIAKPFNVEQMMAMLQRWTGCQSRFAALDQPAGTAPDPSPSASDFDLPGIDISAALSKWGAPNTYKDYLSRFVGLYRKAGDEIAEAGLQGHRRAAAALAHKIKGAAGNLCLNSIAVHCGVVEKAVADDADLVQATSELQSALDEVAGSLANWLATDAHTDRSEPASADRAVILAGLQRLLTALEQDDPTEVRKQLQYLEPLTGRDLIDSIIAQVQEYDFRAAESSTQALIEHFNAPSSR